MPDDLNGQVNGRFRPLQWLYGSPNQYHTLVRLSEEPNHTLRMSELAMVSNQSLSRLSHLVKRLEARGLLRRETDTSDGRFTNAILTEEGHALLVASAPGHVEHVRALVIDAFSAAELRQLREASERILARIDGRQTG